MDIHRISPLSTGEVTFPNAAKKTVAKPPVRSADTADIQNSKISETPSGRPSAKTYEKFPASNFVIDASNAGLQNFNASFIAGPSSNAGLYKLASGDAYTFHVDASSKSGPSAAGNDRLQNYPYVNFTAIAGY